MPDELFLPRAESAEVPEDKLRDYALNPDHATGQHKARVFSSVLAIERANWTYLRDQILDRVAGCPVTVIRPKPPYGVEYEVRIDVEGLNGVTHPIITGWLVPEEGPPWLITAYIDLPRRA